MRRLLLCIFSLLVSMSIWAQRPQPPGGGGQKPDSGSEHQEPPAPPDEQADSTITTQDTSIVEVPEKVRVIMPSLTIDYGKLATTAIGWDEKYEGALSFLFFEQYYIIGEYGKGILEPKSALSNGHYKSEGTYFRLGGGYFKEIKTGYRLGLGARFAQSNYSEQGEIFVKSAEGIQSDYSTSYYRPNLTARWIEIVLSSEAKVKLNKENAQAKINNLLALGFHFRVRIMGSYERFSPIDTYAIPGYGNVLNNPNLGINVYLKVYIF